MRSRRGQAWYEGSFTCFFFCLRSCSAILPALSSGSTSRLRCFSKASLVRVDSEFWVGLMPSVNAPGGLSSAAAMLVDLFHVILSGVVWACSAGCLYFEKKRRCQQSSESHAQTHMQGGTPQLFEHRQGGRLQAPPDRTASGSISTPSELSVFPACASSLP